MAKSLIKFYRSISRSKLDIFLVFDIRYHLQKWIEQQSRPALWDSVVHDWFKVLFFRKSSKTDTEITLIEDEKLITHPTDISEIINKYLVDVGNYWARENNVQNSNHMKNKPVSEIVEFYKSQLFFRSSNLYITILSSTSK